MQNSNIYFLDISIA